MAPRLDSCCCFSTRTGSVIIGSVNLALSVLNIIFFIIYLVALVTAGTYFGVADHWLLVLAYVFLGIGILTALLQFTFCILLIRGIQNRAPKWVRVYLIFGTISVFLGLLSMVLGSFTIFSLVWAIIIALVQVYFLLVIYSEYKNIQDEIASGGAFAESPVVVQKPEIAHPIGFR